MHLDRYSSSDFDRGASFGTEAIWLALSGVFVTSWLPGSGWRRWLLQLFGARIGTNVTIKPGVRVKFPWRLEIGDHAWIGEDVWIDNLAEVTIGSHTCLSQGAYLCTGSHNWARDTFDLIVRPIEIRNHSWVGARATLAPGAVLSEGAVLSMGSLGLGTSKSWTIYSGVPATAQKPRPRPDTDGS